MAKKQTAQQQEQIADTPRGLISIALPQYLIESDATVCFEKSLANPQITMWLPDTGQKFMFVGECQECKGVIYCSGKG